MEEKIIFSNSKEQTLAGILVVPAGAGPFPAIVLCHGFTGWMNEPRWPKLSQALVAAGYAVLRFDFTGNGDSEGELSDGTVQQEESDLLMAIEYLHKKNYIDKERVGVIGHHMGAAIAILAARDNSKIRAIAGLSTLILYDNYGKHSFAPHMDEIGRKRYFMYNKIHYDGIVRVHKITKTFVESLQGTNLEQEVKKVHQPILFVYGTMDETNQSPELIEKLFEAANEPKYIEFIDGADHNFTRKPHEQDVIVKTVHFFKTVFK
jgi:dienelactone hydrolase